MLFIRHGDSAGGREGGRQFPTPEQRRQGSLPAHGVTGSSVLHKQI